MKCCCVHWMSSLFARPSCWAIPVARTVKRWANIVCSSKKIRDANICRLNETISHLAVSALRYLTAFACGSWNFSENPSSESSHADSFLAVFQQILCYVNKSFSPGDNIKALRREFSDQFPFIGKLISENWNVKGVTAWIYVNLNEICFGELAWRWHSRN